MPFSPKASASLFPSLRRKSLAHGEESEMLASSPTFASASSHPHGHFSGLQPSASTSWINPFGSGGVGRASFSVDTRNHRDRDYDDDAYISPGSQPSSRRPSAATIISSLLHGHASKLGRASVDESTSSAERHGGYSSEDATSTTSSHRAGANNKSAAAGGYVPPQVAPAVVNQGRRPSAIFRAFKARRGSASTQAQAQASTLSLATTGAAATQQQQQHGQPTGRRKSSALTRVLQPSSRAAAATATNHRVDEHASTLSTPRESCDTSSSSRRRSLSIVCRGEHDSDDESSSAPLFDPTPRPSGATATTAAMAIRDTWLYGSHQWTPDGRKGSVSTIATSPATHSAMVPRKSLSVAVGLDVEDQEIQHLHLQERLRAAKRKQQQQKQHHGGGDAASVVSLSLTEEIALYTTDVASRRSANSSTGTAPPPPTTTTGASSAKSSSFVPAGGWTMPDWTPRAPTQHHQAAASEGAGGMQRRGSIAAPRLPELSPAPAMLIADPFAKAAAAADMQRVESGELDPGMETASAAMAVQWSQPMWNAASPFRPDAPALPSLPEAAGRARGPSYVGPYEGDEPSPTALNFPSLPPPPPASASFLTAPASPSSVRRRGTTYYDASPLLPILDEVPSSPTTAELLPRSPRSPKSPRTFGTSETSYEMIKAARRTSYSLPRPPPGYSPSVHSNEEDDAPTPRLVGGTEFEGTSPMSSNFAPETPSESAMAFPEVALIGATGAETEAEAEGEVEGADITVTQKRGRKGAEGEGDDLHAQFCSVLLLDLGNGTAIPLSPSPGIEPRPDPFAMLAH